MEYETYADVIDAYNADNMGYSTLTDYIKGQNIKIKEIEMDPIGDMQKIFENKADGGAIGIEVLFKEKMKDGGRVGLFMGGDPLEGQALQIYNSMKNYNFTDQEIADALSARGLYKSGVTELTVPPEGIIGAQLKQGGGDGPKGDFGLFGDLLKDTEKTFTKNVYTEIGPNKFEFVPTEVKGYKNVKTGNYQTEAGKNINHLGIEVPTIAGMLFDKNFGKGPQLGDIEGTFTKGIPAGMKNFFNNPLNIFKKQQATLAEINAMNKKAVDELFAKQEAKKQAALQAKIAAEAAAGKSLSQIGKENFTGEGQAFQAGNIGKSSFTGGKVKDVSSVPGGKYGSPRKDGGLMFADGGLATMFTRRR